MRYFVKFAVVALVLVLGAYAGRYYRDAESAAINCPEIQQCLSEGYSIIACVPQPIYYFVAPTGEYEWGQVNITLIHKNKPTLNATCFINAKDRRGDAIYWETRNVTVPAP